MSRRKVIGFYTDEEKRVRPITAPSGKFKVKLFKIKDLDSPLRPVDEAYIVKQAFIPGESIVIKFGDYEMIITQDSYTPKKMSRTGRIATHIGTTRYIGSVVVKDLKQNNVVENVEFMSTKGWENLNKKIQKYVKSKWNINLGLSEHGDIETVNGRKLERKVIK
jgi:hypothetical protein